MAMGTGQYIFEIFGIVVVGFGAFLLTRIFALAPLQRDLTKMESTCHFCFIPVLVYSSFRLYFGILFHFTKSLSNKRPHVGKFGQISWKCLFGLLFLLLLCLLEGLNVFVSMFLILISLISFVYLFFRLLCVLFACFLLVELLNDLFCAFSCFHPFILSSIL